MYVSTCWMTHSILLFFLLCVLFCLRITAKVLMCVWKTRWSRDREGEQQDPCWKNIELTKTYVTFSCHSRFFPVCQDCAMVQRFCTRGFSIIFSLQITMEVMDTINQDDTIECEICFDNSIVAIPLIPCAHSRSFCEECVKRWLAEGHHTCPKCRNPLPLRKYVSSEFYVIRQRVLFIICIVDVHRSSKYQDGWCVNYNGIQSLIDYWSRTISWSSISDKFLYNAQFSCEFILSFTYSSRVFDLIPILQTHLTKRILP